MEVLLTVVIVLLVVLISRLDRNQREIRKQAAVIEEIYQLIKQKPAPVEPSTAFPKTETHKPTPAAVTPSPIPQQRSAMPKPVSSLPLQPVYRPRLKRKDGGTGWFQKWLKDNPDLEKFIGENLVNKIGIAVLVLGIAFFVKYAIDQNWINEIGRVAIGFLCGGVLMGLAHYLSKNYRSFSSVLAGGGLAVFYFTIAFAFHQYHLISQTVAFLLMCFITLLAVFLALLYDRVELGVIAAVGGFITPLLVSNGAGNYVVLLTYLLILNTGLLFLSLFKQWRLLNWISFLLTLLIVSGWMMQLNDPGYPRINTALALALLASIYLAFLIVNMNNQLRKRSDFHVLDFSLLLLLNGGFFGASLLLMQYAGWDQTQGFFSLAMALINIACAWLFFRQPGANKVLLYLLIGIATTFLTLAIPIQLHGHAITMFWIAEAVLLAWLYNRSGIPNFFYSSIIVILLSVISILMDWMNASASVHAVLPVMFVNFQGLVTNLIFAGGLIVYASMLKQRRLPVGDEELQIALSRISLTAGIIMAFVTAIFTVNWIFIRSTDLALPNLYHRLVCLLSLAVVFIWLQIRFKGRSAIVAVPLLIAYFIYIALSFNYISSLRNGVIAHSAGGWAWALHECTTVASLTLAVVIMRSVYVAKSKIVDFPPVLWALTPLFLVVLSQELMHPFVLLTARPDTVAPAETQYLKAGVTVVWALYSFAMMWLGMKYQYKTLRIISLVVFLLALLKLFLWDLRTVSEGGKIIAFILLGVLLLTISFMYQKLKRIILDEKI